MSSLEAYLEKYESFLHESERNLLKEFERSSVIKGSIPRAIKQSDRNGLKAYLTENTKRVLYYTALVREAQNGNMDAIKEAELAKTDVTHCLHKLFLGAEEWQRKVKQANEVLQELEDKLGKELVSQVMISRVTSKINSTKAKEHANIGHKRNRNKHVKIQESWATGAYSSRDECAEKEHERLGMAYSTARKALQNIPEPPKKKA